MNDIRIKHRGWCRIKPDEGFRGGFVVVNGNRYLTCLSPFTDKGWFLTRIWARRWVFGSEREAKEVREGLE